jgi:hypothetical protein
MRSTESPANKLFKELNPDFVPKIQGKQKIDKREMSKLANKTFIVVPKKYVSYYFHE